ncbi:hypothetical protein V3851_08225 [Paenibacillus sp. M1]|uniref:Phosphoribulokinase/uridine kinase domain-containing protein n=1 Tax=Paenibacillus haidiansis TaxID=1574488 RepID=A0ABU7VPX9_9BACL
MKPTVIAVSGYSGSGKSTVVTQLSRKLKCAALYFDDYASRKDFPEDLNAWLREGGDPNVIKTPLLQHHLMQLLNGEPVELRKGNGWAEEYGIAHDKSKAEMIMPSSFIIVEEPFGKERKEIMNFVDFVVYLDVEPEVALARRVHNLIHCLRNDPEALIGFLDHFLFDYMYRGVKEMYREVGNKVKANADLIVHANESIDEIVVNISDFIENQRQL